MKMGKHLKSKRELYSILFILILLLIANVSAITGSIGNARMVLRVNQGDEIDKCILVKNVNDVNVNIELSANGDLADYVNIKDKKFTLLAKEEKKACFTLEAKKSGTTETKINVMFVPTNGDNGVGLSSTIIVIAKDMGLSSLVVGENEEVEDEREDREEITSSSTDGQENPINKKNSKKLILTSSIITIVLFGLLVILLVVYSIRKNLNSSKEFNGLYKKLEVKEENKPKKRVNRNE